MALIKWNSALATGDASIDAGHKQLITYMNDMHAALARGKSKHAIGQILETLVVCTRQHLAAEEAVWATSHYLHLEVHKRQHAELLAGLDDLKQEFDAGAGLPTPEVMEFLSRWLMRHILGSDVVAARTCRTMAA
jgi:hemerythrin